MKKELCDSKDYFWCNSNKKIEWTNVCNFVKDCPDGSDELNCGNCDFESGNCSYSIHNSIDQNQFNWRLGDSQVGPKIGYLGNYVH